LPIIEFDHSLENCSITGGYRYQGSLYPSLTGTYFYADFCSGRILGANLNISGNWATEELLDSDLLISTFGGDESDELYLAHFSSSDGTIYKVTETTPAATGGGEGSDGGRCFVSTATKF
jgi:hypothetical protein